MKTCATCRHRGPESSGAAFADKPLYDCRALNKTPRLEIMGGHAPWVQVRNDFGCVLWKKKAAVVMKEASHDAL